MTFLSLKNDVNVQLFRIRMCKIPMFFILPDLHPYTLVTSSDLAPDPSIIKQK